MANPSLKARHAFFSASTEPNFDDDDLEEIQELLWRGYVPEPYARHDLDIYSSLDHPIWRPHVGPKERKAAETERAERYAELERQQAELRTVPQYSEFRCDNCHRTFRSIKDETEAEAEYLATFGEAATENRLAVCEHCYNRMMRGIRWAP